MKLLEMRYFISKVHEFLDHLEWSEGRLESTPEYTTLEDELEHRRWVHSEVQELTKARLEILEKLQDKSINNSLFINDTCLGRVLKDTQAKLDRAEYGSPTWHYLSGKVEGLTAVYESVASLPEV